MLPKMIFIIGVSAICAFANASVIRSVAFYQTFVQNTDTDIKAEDSILKSLITYNKKYLLQQALYPKHGYTGFVNMKAEKNKTYILFEKDKFYFHRQEGTIDTVQFSGYTVSAIKKKQIFNELIVKKNDPLLNMYFKEIKFKGVFILGTKNIDSSEDTLLNSICISDTTLIIDDYDGVTKIFTIR